MTMTTVTARTPAESRAAIASLNVGDSFRCPGVSGFTFRVEGRFIGPSGRLTLRIQGEDATGTGLLYPNEYNNGGGFWLCPFVDGASKWIPGFEIVAHHP
jgi:hypothetical protein